MEGGRPEIVFVVGDGVGPLMMYEWGKGTWLPKTSSKASITATVSLCSILTGTAIWTSSAVKCG